MQEHGDRERDVESSVGERQLRSVAVADVDAGAARQTARSRHHRATRIDPGQAAAAPDERYQVAQDHARPAPDFEDRVATADRDRAQEGEAQPALSGIATTLLERLHERGRVGGTVDLAKRVGVRHASRRAHTSLQKYRGPSGPGRAIARERTTYV